ncbi:MAG: BrnT family toxin [Rhizomicrobium sp.]
MKFEFDQSKSAANKQKHGIDFEEAQKIWDNDDWLELPVPSVEEQRYVIIGMIDEKHGTAVVTYRADRIRLISVRRARDVEIACYEG